MQKAISIKNLSANYGKNLIFENISFEIPSEIRCGLVGPNGAGKTTLFRSILSLHESYSGEIKFFEKSFDEFRKKIAYVPQRKNVDWTFPINLYDMVMMGANNVIKNIFSKISEQTHKKTINALTSVDLLALKNNHIDNLSGGQQQRAFVARALAQEAEIYLMDEPFTGLDTYSEKKISEIFETLKKNKKTIFAVHHDKNTLLDYFDWVIFFNKKINYCGPIENCDIKKMFEITL
jgi:manganese/zinc/iron transport system ATP- binding protein